MTGSDLNNRMTVTYRFKLESQYLTTNKTHYERIVTEIIDTKDGIML
jgi:hypothetical protein